MVTWSHFSFFLLEVHGDTKEDLKRTNMEAVLTALWGCQLFITIATCPLEEYIQNRDGKEDGKKITLYRVPAYMKYTNISSYAATQSSRSDLRMHGYP